MLGKLFKYEMRATARTFLPMFGALVLLGIINRLYYAGVVNNYMFYDNWVLDLIYGLIITVYVLLLCAVFVVTFIVIVQRFYKNLLGDEGYLMFTLPVPPWKHIASKMLASGVWTLSGILVTILSVSIMVLNSDVIEFFRDYFWEGWTEVSLWIQMPAGFFLLEILLILICSVFFGILPIYCALAIGQLWQKHKIIGAFLAYIGISVVNQMVSSIVLNLVVRNTDYYSMTFERSGPYAHSVMLVFFFISLIISGACFFVTHYLLSRRLNLE